MTADAKARPQGRAFALRDELQHNCAMAPKGTASTMEGMQERRGSARIAWRAPLPGNVRKRDPLSGGRGALFPLSRSLLSWARLGPSGFREFGPPGSQTLLLRPGLGNRKKGGFAGTSTPLPTRRAAG